MIEKLPEIQIHSCAKINEKLNEVIDWINDVSAFRVTDKQVTANLPNTDAGELAFLSKENTELKDEIDRLETELERTRKALDAAKDAVVLFCEKANIAMRALAEISKQDTDWCNKGYLVAIARKALDQITALEQKDVK